MADWDKIKSHGNVDDRRGGGIFTFGANTQILSILGVLVLGFFGININTQTLQSLLEVANVATSSTQDKSKGVDDGYREFSSAVLGSTNDYWKTQFSSNNLSYKDPRLVLFRSATQSGCGYASTEVGPHYCPNDQTIYLDETFFDTMKTRLGGSNGDVAQAYVIAHEVGHHVQNLTGTMAKVQNDPNYQATGENSLSVRLELQADCYAGLWAKSVSNIFESENEIKEAISAAEAVGDDHIQKTSGTNINPETWTHGSSDDRVRSFEKGYSNTSMKACTL
jgi:predicted metalloprotease